MAWTLVQSYKFKEKGHIKNFKENKPMNADQNESPSWAKYRLSKDKMQTIWDKSTKWRFTCEYDKLKEVSDEHMIVATSQKDIFQEYVECLHVDYIKVRERDCSKCTALLVQSGSDPMKFLSGPQPNHVCDFRYQFNATSCSNVNINYFGHYRCSDDQHACSTEESSTTQTWFGGD